MRGKMYIPLVDLKREYTFLKRDVHKNITLLLKKHQWVLGPFLSKFEKQVANYLGARYAVGVASGTDALVLALRAMAYKFRKKDSFDRRDEIITTPLTFIATAEAIMRVGATPVFVDVDTETFNISPAAVEKALTKNTVGILPVHLYGKASDMAKIMSVARKYGLFVVEDTAQAFGGEYNGKKLGTIGHMGVYSFFPSKNLGGYGDGGLVVTSSKILADYVRILRNHGQVKPYIADYLGYNSRLDSFQAAILLAKLKYIDRFNKMRKKFARIYDEGFCDVKEIVIPSRENNVYHLYTIRVLRRRDDLLLRLNQKGIGARVYYPVLLPKMKAFNKCIIGGSIRYAKRLVKEIISLPLHPFLKEIEVRHIIREVRQFFNA